MDSFCIVIQWQSNRLTFQNIPAPSASLFSLAKPSGCPGPKRTVSSSGWCCFPASAGSLPARPCTFPPPQTSPLSRGALRASCFCTWSIWTGRTPCRRRSAPPSGASSTWLERSGFSPCPAPRQGCRSCEWTVGRPREAPEPPCDTSDTGSEIHRRSPDPQDSAGRSCGGREGIEGIGTPLGTPRRSGSCCPRRVRLGRGAVVTSPWLRLAAVSTCHECAVDWSCLYQYLPEKPDLELLLHCAHQQQSLVSLKMAIV